MYYRAVSLPVDAATTAARATLGRCLLLARVRSGLAQEQVADSLGARRATLSGWENGRTAPDAVTLMRLAAIYGLTLDALVGLAPLPPAARSHLA